MSSHSKMQYPPLPARLLKFIYLPIAISVILGVMAGTDIQSSSPGDVSKGHTYQKACVILVAVALTCLSTVVCLICIHLQRVVAEDQELFKQDDKVSAFLCQCLLIYLDIERVE